jgi:hypothetical protein
MCCAGGPLKWAWEEDERTFGQLFSLLPKLISEESALFLISLVPLQSRHPSFATGCNPHSGWLGLPALGGFDRRRRQMERLDGQGRAAANDVALGSG